MLSKHAFRTRARIGLKHNCVPIFQYRLLHHDGRNRLSNFFVPTQRKPADTSGPENGHDLLIRAGFLRQAYSGIFHLLPFGLRVQNKIEQLIDKHMLSLGASKVSLSSLSSEELWQRTGRLDKGRSSELLRLEDRKGAKFLLSPTHEEEITSIIANAVHSYRDLPLRLYQVSRKYRDEPRPRQGLLRGREFLMKDLYTFDVTEKDARKTYESVRGAYVAFLEDLKLPYLVARADSGNMGGTLSHEYHFASPQGEDTIITCDKCNNSINEELYIGSYKIDAPPDAVSRKAQDRVETEQYVSKDRKKLCSIYYPADLGEPNIYAVKALFPDIDASLSGEQAMKEFKPKSTDASHDQVHYYDPRLSPDALIKMSKAGGPSEYQLPSVNHRSMVLTKARENDACANCKTGKVKLKQAIEIGHTFHLGTRYSDDLQAHVLDANNETVSIEMGCHGIGVSRLIGAIASLLADSKGLNWPLAIAPFDVVVVGARTADEADVGAVYDMLTLGGVAQKQLDVVLDDRDKPTAWKLNDADLIGYPFIVVVGNAWRERGVVELQCRRLGLKTEEELDDLPARIDQESRRL